MADETAMKLRAAVHVTSVVKPSAPCCPRCESLVPRLRVPTPLHPLLWGGWTYTQCSGLGLSQQRQLISGRLDSSDGIVVALKSPHRRCGKRLSRLSLCPLPDVGMLDPDASGAAMDGLLIPRSLGVSILWGCSEYLGSPKRVIALTDAAIRQDGSTFRPRRSPMCPGRVPRRS